MNNNRIIFLIALVTVFIYEVVMIVYSLDGFSLFKLVITALLWVSFIATFFFFINNFSFFRKTMPPFALLLIMLLLVWNVIGILRSVVSREESATTLFGNLNYVLALLFPFFIVFSVNKDLLRIIHEYFKALLKVGVFLMVIFLITNGLVFHISQHLLLLNFFLPVIFLLTVLPYFDKKSKTLILFSSIFLFYVSYKYGNRTMMIREILLFLSFMALYLYARFNLKFILRFAFLIVLVPMILIQQSSRSGESPIEEFLSESDNTDSDLNVDTRTFLYTELFDDMINTGTLLFGKGAGGKYYSNVFSEDFGYATTRESVEVGVLAILLKGGLVAVVLNLLIFILAIYYAFFKSKNYYVVGIGFMILVYTIIYFLENFSQYSSYNIWIWFFIGICFSKPIRNMKNSEIKLILNNSGI